MCQLVGYIGDRPIAPLLLKALELQEPYWGAHATGLGVLSPRGISIVKDRGHVEKVSKSSSISKLEGTTGIAHSRYSSTAREDPRFNLACMAHPFTNNDETIALMHNGIIRNYMDHWNKLKEKHVFKSHSRVVDNITDSEIAVHMVSDLVKSGLEMGETFKEVFPQLKGTILLSAITKNEPDTIYVANRYQPCYVGVGDEETIWCSSKAGLKPIQDELKEIWEPPKNSLLKLTRGAVETQVLDPSLEVPDLRLNKTLLKKIILTIIEAGETDFRSIDKALGYNAGWAKVYDVPPEEWRNLTRFMLEIVNPLIETLDELIAEGKITRRISPRLEGGVPDTPRYAYSLA
jgi:glutamine phosphoribosylpyrophosphate amidotransferase